MLKTLSKLNTCVYYWNSVENTPNNYGKRFPPLLRVFPVTPTVVNNSVGNGFYDGVPGNSSTQNELKSKKSSFHKGSIQKRERETLYYLISFATTNCFDVGGVSQLFHLILR